MPIKTCLPWIVDAVGRWPNIGVGVLAAAGLVYWNAAATMLGG